MKKILVLSALALALVACNKDAPSHMETDYDDAEHIENCLLAIGRQEGSLHAIQGVTYVQDRKQVVLIPVSSLAEAKSHFKSLAHDQAMIKESGNKIVWRMTDTKGESQGEAVFLPKDDRILAVVTLPESCQRLDMIEYIVKNKYPFQAVDPKVREDLEDNYYYGAIVDISDHGCGSGKFVVIREYNFDTTENGMAIHLGTKLEDYGMDDHEWIKACDRSSCRNTLGIAGTILNYDPDVLRTQLSRSGSNTNWNNHFLSADRQWTGKHYYYNIATGDYDTIGPFSDLEFYEAWVYYFLPNGDHIDFW